MNSTEETHESYGLISFSRVSGGGQHFFGTNMTPQHWFELRIHRAKKLVDEFGEEKFWPDHSKANIIELRITAHQFTELITTMNMGNGVPCTLQEVSEKKLDECPQQTVAIDNAINIAIEKTSGDDYTKETIKKVRDILKSEKAINKKDREILTSAFVDLESRMQSNAEFYKQQLCEVGDKVKTEIKTEINAQMLAVVHKLGIESIRKAKELDYNS